jgi:hypothetical protein
VLISSRFLTISNKVEPKTSHCAIESQERYFSDATFLFDRKEEDENLSPPWFSKVK